MIGGLGGSRGRGDAGTRRLGDVGTWGRGDTGTRGRGDVGTWGRGDVGTYRIVSTQGVLNSVGRRNDITQEWEFCRL